MSVAPAARFGSATARCDEVCPTPLSAASPKKESAAPAALALAAMVTCALAGGLAAPMEKAPAADQDASDAETESTAAESANEGSASGACHHSDAEAEVEGGAAAWCSVSHRLAGAFRRLADDGLSEDEDLPRERPVDVEAWRSVGCAVLRSLRQFAEEEYGGGDEWRVASIKTLADEEHDGDDEGEGPEPRVDVAAWRSTGGRVLRSLRQLATEDDEPEPEAEVPTPTDAWQRVGRRVSAGLRRCVAELDAGGAEAPEWLVA